MDYSAQAKMEEAAKAQAFARVGNIPQTPQLIRVTGQIEAAIDRIADACNELAQHADRVFGEQAAAGEGASAKPVRMGALGALEDTADRLDYVVGRLREVTERSCKLA